MLDLVLPVLVAGVGVFIASALVHMVFKWHNADYRKFANEDAVSAAMRAGAPAPGIYTLPFCADGKAMQDEAMQARFREGPNAMVTLRAPGAPEMGKMLGTWFLLNLVVAQLVFLVAWMVYGPGGNVQAAILGAILTFLAYAGASPQQGIWFGKPWGVVAREMLDGALYAATTGLAFWALWPKFIEG